MYFPLIVHGAMLIEPTETESKASLDRFIAVVNALAAAARREIGGFRAAPIHTRVAGSTKPPPPASRCCAGAPTGAAREWR